MANTKKKKKRLNFKTILVLIVIGYAAFTLIHQQITIEKLRHRESDIRAKIADLQADNERLNAMIKNVSTMEYIEKMAREQLHMVKPGEKVYIDLGKSADNNLRGGGN